MKKKINILCAVVFVTVALSLVPFLYYFGLGMKQGIDAGMQAADNGQNCIEAMEVIQKYKSVTLLPDQTFFNNVTVGTIKNDKTGEDVNIVPVKIMVNAQTNNPKVYDVVNTINEWTDIILSIITLIMFIKFIMNVNRKEVFTWKNVRLLRRIGWCMLAMAVLSTGLGVYEEYMISEVFSVKGYSASFLEYLSSSDLLIGIVALIIAEAFAIGLKQKEELELTI